MKIVILLLLAFSSAFAEEVIYEIKKTGIEKPKVKVKKENIYGNLPNYFANRSSKNTKLSSISIIRPDKSLNEVLTQLKQGEKFNSKVNHSIIAFPDEKAPVVAEYKGYKFIGESKLEPNTKRIFLDFTKVIYLNRSYPIKAVGLNELGQPGIEGDYYSQELKYFGGEFVSSTIAAYFDALVPRRQNPYGYLTEDNSVDSAVKKGLSAGALSSAERFRKKLLKTPEFSEVHGPISLQVLVLDTNN